MAFLISLKCFLVCFRSFCFVNLPPPDASPFRGGAGGGNATKHLFCFVRKGVFMFDFVNGVCDNLESILFDFRDSPFVSLSLKFLFICLPFYILGRFFSYFFRQDVSHFWQSIVGFCRSCVLKFLRFFYLPVPDPDADSNSQPSSNDESTSGTNGLLPNERVEPGASDPAQRSSVSPSPRSPKKK